MDLQAERAAVLSAEAAWGEAIERHDLDGVLAFFADDGVSLPSGGPPIQGREARRAWLEALFAEPGFDSTWQTTRVEIAAAGDMALSVGTTSHGAGIAADGSPLVERGKYVTVWKKVDGTWKVAADIWNADAPPDAP